MGDVLRLREDKIGSYHGFNGALWSFFEESACAFGKSFDEYERQLRTKLDLSTALLK